MTTIQQISLNHSKFTQSQNIEYRINSLIKFKETIIKYEKNIFESLYLDLGKSAKESFLSEVNESIEEIENHIKHLKKWATPKKVKSTYQVFGTKSYIYKQPKGKVLLIVPFNYPINLCFLPLIGAISAGNNVLIKMSSLTANTNIIVKKIINEAFNANHVEVYNDKLNDYDELFEYQPNMVFFTGSTNVGKQIEAKCVQKNIEYVTELGGECPCVVFDELNPSIYDRIVWAKFLNAGQTCVSINYILYNKHISNFDQKLVNSIKTQFPNSLKEKNIPKLINQKAFYKMVNIINENKENIIYGGNYDELTNHVEPTVIKLNPNDLHKYGEIFGPILFICPLENDLNKYIEVINNIDNSPLAAYIYTNNMNVYEKFIKEVNAGGYCVNDSLVHITNHNLPFGGVYSSGSGKYHGIYSFNSFSFTKSVLINNSKSNLPIKFINNNINLEKVKKLFKIIKIFKK